MSNMREQNIGVVRTTVSKYRNRSIPQTVE